MPQGQQLSTPLGGENAPPARPSPLTVAARAQHFQVLVQLLRPLLLLLWSLLDELHIARVGGGGPPLALGRPRGPVVLAGVQREVYNILIMWRHDCEPRKASAGPGLNSSGAGEVLPVGDRRAQRSIVVASGSKPNTKLGSGASCISTALHFAQWTAIPTALQHPVQVFLESRNP